MIKYFVILFLLFNISELCFANTSFSIGLETDITFISFDTTTENIFISDNVIQYNSILYIGIVGSYIIGVNQITFSFLPSISSSTSHVKIYPSTMNISFSFYEAYMRFDGLTTSISLGKQQLGWGVGTLRQYSFFENTSFQDKKNRFYSLEILYRNNAILFSVGTAIDTESIDLLDKPEWYTPWMYLRYDQQQYTILGSLIINYQNEVYDVKVAFDFQYFLPNNFSIYNSLAYIILNDNIVGEFQNIRFLVGLDYQYSYNNDIIIRPTIEYAWENNNLFTIGVVLLLYQIDWLLFFNYTYDDQKNHIPAFFTRIKWNAHTIFNILIEYNYINSVNLTENIINISLEVKL